jgi:hypothetical protein
MPWPPPPILLCPCTAAAPPPLLRCRGIGSFLLNLEVESIKIAMRCFDNQVFKVFILCVLHDIIHHNVLVKILMVVQQEIQERKNMFG